MDFQSLRQKFAIKNDSSHYPTLQCDFYLGIFSQYLKFGLPNQVFVSFLNLEIFPVSKH
jgi:hypothetical protein